MTNRIKEIVILSLLLIAFFFHINAQLQADYSLKYDKLETHEKIKYIMIRYIKNGNIFTIDGINCYAHGCNCAGAMGKGIALQFRSKYPEMYKQYKKSCIDGHFILGDVFEYVSGNERIYNLGTQKTWRTHADLVAIKTAIGKMLTMASKSNVKSIALPKIGAGLGGLNWDSVKSAIEEVALNFPNIELVIVENYSE